MIFSRPSGIQGHWGQKVIWILSQKLFDLSMSSVIYSMSPPRRVTEDQAAILDFKVTDFKKEIRHFQSWGIRTFSPELYGPSTSDLVHITSLVTDRNLNNFPETILDRKGTEVETVFSCF